MKKIMWGLLVLIIILVSVILLVPAKTPVVEVKQPAVILPASPKDATYNVEDVGVTLVGGQGTALVGPNVADEVTTRMFGEPVMGDIDGDGDLDAAVMLTQETSGTGLFYYIAAAINTGNGYRGTNALYLGDRIAPQPTNITGGEIIANFAERGPNEPFTARPSFGRSVYAKIVGDLLVEVQKGN